MPSNYGVSTAHPLATEVGLKILEKGGNAVDASVAISFVLGVVEPYASGIGGGGNMLIFPEKETKPILYDYREIAPTELKREYNIGVPGFVKGMERILNEYGRLSLKDVLEPAIKLAKQGFEISDIIANNIKETKHEQVKRLDHYWPEGIPLKTGHKLIQKELATVLKHISEEGSKYFYEGSFAQNIVDADIGITLEDLNTYDVKIREPLLGKYQSYDIWSAPAPVSGSVIILTLSLLEKLGIDNYETNSPEYITGLSQVLRVVLEELYGQVADPDFVEINEQELLSSLNIQKLTEKIKHNNKYPQFYLKDESHTTHFSVIDRQGMVVSTTNTLSNFFGSGVYIKGVFFNNQMQNFSDDTSSPNCIKVGKRCISIIAPTILSKDGKPMMTVGASGAARIPTIITKTIVDYIKHGVNIAETIASKRFFVKEEEVYLEEELTEEMIRNLENYGLKYVHFPEPMFYGGVQAIVKEKDILNGAADPRRGGTFQAMK